ncbi:MAG: GNAT family N-acetyltransferase [Lachnospiraceae bacterium]|nr:GNAT family N-acetyltransferase [Lachnospiraceae bacterium]
MIRLAHREDAGQIAAIYDKIHTGEEKGETTIGWIREIYPTLQTAREAIEAGDMFVLEEDGRIVASGRINQIQVPEYKDAHWQYEADPSEVMVLHTLTVDPDQGRRGLARQFVSFYEEYALKNGCRYLRIDTNERNTRARKMYEKLGYHEVGVVPCNFNGIPNIGLVCIEKRLE